MNIRICQSKVFFCAGLVLFLLGLVGTPVNADSSSFDHSLFTRILQKYVDEQGRVNYQGLKDQGREELEAYVKNLENAVPSRMSEKEGMAFYINAYNAFTLKLIVDNYPLESIRKIPDLSGIAGLGQWKKDLWALENKKVSLDTIEHEILRPMGDPRVHFALVCAAKSCPSLARNAYTAANLDEMLDEQGRRFNQSPKGLRTSMEKRFFGSRPVLKLSSIYKWFKGDFLRGSDNLPDFVRPYANASTRAFIETHGKDLKIEYMAYDWDLNDQQ